jgi:hypothetical protein
MTLSRRDYAIEGTNSGANVIRLAGFLRDDDLISHNGSFGRIDSALADENVQRTTGSRKPLFELAVRLFIALNEHTDDEVRHACAMGLDLGAP